MQKFFLSLTCWLAFASPCLANQPITGPAPNSEAACSMSTSRSTCRFAPQEFGFAAGYGWGSAKEGNPGNNYQVYPIFFQLGYSLNKILGLEKHRGKMQLVVEPFANPVHDPRDGFEVGVAFLFKYSYPFLKKLRVYGEFGSGPMYLSLRTQEQGSAGFNFLDQAGVGFQFMITADKSINIGYRASHISDLSWGDNNNGLNGQRIFIGFSKHF